MLQAVVSAYHIFIGPFALFQCISDILIRAVYGVLRKKYSVILLATWTDKAFKPLSFRTSSEIKGEPWSICGVLSLRH
jgi:hypothetical protein